MKMNTVLSFVLLIMFCFCHSPHESAVNRSDASHSESEFSGINPDGMIIQDRFPVPSGYQRLVADSPSFAYYLRHLPLKPHGSKVYLYNGQLKGNQDAHVAVIDIDVGTSDLQQCADAVMRLRAEYLYYNGQQEKISFHFTNGFEVPWTKYTQGYRVAVNGNKTSWVMKSKPGAGYKEFRSYMNLIFSYAGSLSLSKELKAKRVEDIEPGDVFIVGGSPGHAVIVLDVAEKIGGGERLFLLGQSYMPAQEIHVLKNPGNDDDNPWYSNLINNNLLTPEWLFDKEELKRF